MSFCLLPIELKELPSKFNELIEEVKGLKKQVHNLEIELPGELKEIPTKLEDFTKTVKSLTSQVAIGLKKTKDNSVSSAGQAGTQLAEGEKITNQPPSLNKGKKALSSEEAEKESTNTDSDVDETHMTRSMVESSRIKKKIEEEAKAEAVKRESEVRKEELVDLLGLEVVNKKGPITLKVYKEDGTSEIIPNFKASDLHLGEWREDPLNKLNDHANKKRKYVDDIHDYFKANKILKSLVQYEDHLAGTVLNEHALGPGLDDHARTFSSFLLAEVDKRNLNPLKQMKVIEQLRQWNERDIESKDPSLPINVKRIEELSYLSNKLNRTAEAEAEASVLVINLQGQQYLFLSAYTVGIMIISQMIVYTIPHSTKKKQSIFVESADTITRPLDEPTFKRLIVELAKALKHSKVSFSIPADGIYGELGVNTFRNAIGAHYLPHSSEYIAPSSIDIVRPWFETIGYKEKVPTKGTLKKSLLPPRWRL
ncbi:hypothetical protein Tco_0626838 [Tanacetum coccineum]|uniref:Uncharacterized protein n=1 Tax=Tanacetum coccineum TaxID=301880 RepID=A0ABQ4WLK1_9ASTR